MAEEYIAEHIEEHNDEQNEDQNEEHIEEQHEEHIEEQNEEHIEEHIEEHSEEHNEEQIGEQIEKQELGDLPENSHPPEENFEEQGMGGIPENAQPPEVQGSEHDSKADNSAVAEEKKWPGWPGENVFRMLVPVQKVGSIIGRKGEYIKKTCEETKARIKILDGPPGTTERTVMISAREEPDNPVPPAMDGLLKVHKRIVDVDADPADAQPGAGLTVCTRMLVAGTQGGSLIGKQGATIKSIQDASNCTIRVLGGENLPFFALPDDSVVEVQGEPTGVHKALELIATHLRKFLVDRSVIGVFEMQMQNARGNQDMPHPQSWGPSPQGFPMNAGGGPGYAPIPQYVPPQRQFDNYYPPADMPPLEKRPRHGPPTYSREASMGTHTTNVEPHQSMVTKVSQNMQIPLIYADTVIGESGTNISYIRRASGATIAIQESRGIPGEMTVEINGSASQVQTAQQLIQNFIAEAASAAQNSAPPSGQGYNPYQNHGAAYPSQQPDATGHVPTGDYASMYGNNYGY